MILRAPVKSSSHMHSRHAFTLPRMQTFAAAYCEQAKCTCRVGALVAAEAVARLQLAPVRVIGPRHVPSGLGALRAA